MVCEGFAVLNNYNITTVKTEKHYSSYVLICNLKSIPGWSHDPWTFLALFKKKTISLQPFQPLTFCPLRGSWPKLAQSPHQWHTSQEFVLPSPWPVSADTSCSHTSVLGSNITHRLKPRLRGQVFRDHQGRDVCFVSVKRFLTNYITRRLEGKLTLGAFQDGYYKRYFFLSAHTHTRIQTHIFCWGLAVCLAEARVPSASCSKPWCIYAEKTWPRVISWSTSHLSSWLLPHFNKVVPSSHTHTSSKPSGPDERNQRHVTHKRMEEGLWWCISVCVCVCVCVCRS